VLELRIVLAKFPIALSDFMKPSGGSTDFLGATKYSFQNGNQSFHIGKVNLGGLNVTVNLVLSIAIEIGINIAELALIINVSGGFTGELRAYFRYEVQ
jgi:hypothetical protein